MTNGFIRLYENGRDDNTGYKLSASIIAEFGFTKGIQTSDLATPGQAVRVLFPTTGLVEDYDISIELIDDGTNKGFQVNAAGAEIPLNVITIEEQINFLLENMFTTDISTEHGVRVEYLEQEYIGNLTVRGNLNSESYFSVGIVQATLKVGKNIFGF